MTDVGVIGVGLMGRNHARVYSEMKSVESVALFDINTSAAKEVAKTHNLHVCDSLSKLSSIVDAVSICVPTQYHFNIAKEMINYGIPVLVEKPICQTVSEAKELIELIPPNAIVGVGHIERFNPIVNEIMKILNKPLYIEIKRHNPASARLTGSSVVEDLMIHDIDILFNVLLNGEYSLYSAGNQDICTALFTFGKIPVYLSASRKSSKKIRMIYIEEEEYTIQGNFMSQEIFVYRKPKHYSDENSRYIQDNIIEKVVVNKLEPLKTELNTFIECVKYKRKFPITPQEAFKNLVICELIKKKLDKTIEKKGDMQEIMHPLLVAT